MIRFFLLAILGSTSACLAGSRPEEPTRPNIFVILADDLGYGDVRAFNPDGKIPTPNLDRLATSGMRFTDAHTPSAVCSPTRYSLLTGRYCWRTELERGVLQVPSPALIEPGRATMASMLRSAGYRTAGVGKWHLGLDYGRDAEGAIDYGLPVAGGPLDHGFDEYFGIPASLDMQPYFYLDGREVVEEPSVESPEGRFPGFMRGGLRAPGFDATRCLSVLTDKACAVVEDHAEEDAPLFLYFAMTAPHKPVLVEERFRGSSGLGPYGDFVVAVDDAVGRVLASIDRAGLAEETLVIFTSDNGSFMRRRDADDARDHVDDETIAAYRADRHRSNGPFRGTKADIWEAGHRVPFIVRWPERVEPGADCDTTISHVDLFATAAALAQHPLGDAEAEDSFDVSALFFGRALAAPRAPVIHHSANGTFAIRSGNHKLVAGNGSGGREQPIGEAFGRPYQLFDLSQDPGESTNLIQRLPEVAADLEQALETIRSTEAD